VSAKRTTKKPARPKIQSSHGTGKAKPTRPAAPARGPAAARKAAPVKTRGLPGRPKLPEGRSTESKARAAEPKEPRKRVLPKREDGPSVASEAARALAIQVATAALDKKAMGLEIIDVAGRIDYADFLILMTGRSDRHVVALAQGIEDALSKVGKRPLSTEGLPHARWVLMDFGDVVVHVLQEEARGTYDLDGLWIDARRIPVPQTPDNAPN